jgi:hypothetical protein
MLSLKNLVKKEKIIPLKPYLDKVQVRELDMSHYDEAINKVAEKLSNLSELLEEDNEVFEEMINHLEFSRQLYFEISLNYSDSLLYLEETLEQNLSPEEKEGVQSFIRSFREEYTKCNKWIMTVQKVQENLYGNYPSNKDF